MFNFANRAPFPFGPRSTADHVLAGSDLSNKVFLVTGCDGGIGLATLPALAANGGTVIGLARTLAKAASACTSGGSACRPITCDLVNLHSVRKAAEAVMQRNMPIDAIIANAGVAEIPHPQTRYGVDEHFLVNYLSHTLLIDQLIERVRDGRSHRGNHRQRRC